MLCKGYIKYVKYIKDYNTYNGKQWNTMENIYLNSVSPHCLVF